LDAARQDYCSLSALHEQVPGIVLFRPRDDTKILALLLVGETATSGLNKLALMKSFEWINETNSTQIRILGPSFSGSVWSLCTAIGKWIDHSQSVPEWTFTIISGAASAPENKKTLEDFRCEGPGQRQKFLKDKANVAFHATVHSDDLSIKFLKHYLEQSL